MLVRKVLRRVVAGREVMKAIFLFVRCGFEGDGLMSKAAAAVYGGFLDGL